MTNPTSLLSSSSLHLLQIDEVIDRIRVMRLQEETTYRYQNFLPSSSGINGHQRSHHQHDNNMMMETTSTPSTSSSMDTPAIRSINVVWREKICQWSYNVVDHFDLSREVVAVSLSLFDRYFATMGNHYNGTIALLASLTTLHIAIKLHDTKKIKLCTLANLSRGQFTTRDIETMEWNILNTLQWKLHPPTPYTFIEHLLLLLPSEVHHSVRRGLNEVSKYLTELAICDVYFVDHGKSSTIAYAAILNVMDDMNYSKLSARLRDMFISNIAQYCTDLHPHSDDIMKTRQRLRKMLTVSSTIHDNNNSNNVINTIKK